MEESISKFLALAESSSDSQDALRKMTLALQGLQLNEEESAVSYIDFIKFKFQRKVRSHRSCCMSTLPHGAHTIDTGYP